MGALKTYIVVDDITGGELNTNKIKTEINDSGYVTNFTGVGGGKIETSPDVWQECLIVNGDSFSNEAALDTLVADHVAFTLDEYRGPKFAAIDKKTRKLIALGYEYPAASGNILSLSKEAQLTLVEKNEDRADLSYSQSFNTIDDLDTVSIADATAMHSMYNTAIGVKDGHLDTGTSLKDSVRAAANKAAVDAVTDSR